MSQTNSAAKLILVKDLESYYKSITSKKHIFINVRVLAILEKLISKQSICSYITKFPNSSEKEFWTAMLSQSDTNKPEFDDIYGVINYNNHLFLIEAGCILMQYSIKEHGVYYFIGELEEVNFGILKKIVLKPKIVIPADNINFHIFEQLLSLFEKSNL